MKEKTNKAWSMHKTLVGTEQSAQADILRSSVNKVFWKISQNSQENACAEFSF